MRAERGNSARRAAEVLQKEGEEKSERRQGGRRSGQGEGGGQGVAPEGQGKGNPCLRLIHLFFIRKLFAE